MNTQVPEHAHDGNWDDDKGNQEAHENTLGEEGVGVEKSCWLGGRRLFWQLSRAKAVLLGKVFCLAGRVQNQEVVLNLALKVGNDLGEDGV